MSKAFFESNSSKAIFATQYQKLPQRSIIRNLVGGFILILFSFSIVPKKMLHDAVTDHVEFAAKMGTKESQFHDTNNGISCKCENLFAQPVFIISTQIFEISTAAVFPLLAETYSDRFYTFHRFFFELRGPPAIALA